MLNWVNPLGSPESFDAWGKILAALFTTAAGVLVVASWRKGNSEKVKRRLVLCERVCLVIGVVFAWVTLYSGNKVSDRQEALLSQAANRLVLAESKLRPREITAEQRTNLINCLSSAPKGRVVILASVLDGEATMYAAGIDDALSSAGFAVRRPTGIQGDSILGGDPPGTRMSIHSPSNIPPHAVWIQQCFSNFCNVVIGGQFRPEVELNTVEINVGSR